MEVYKDMEQWEGIRRRVLCEGVSKRQILRETGMHWTTLEKILTRSAPMGYRAKRPRKKQKIGPYLERVKTILKEDKKIPKKQRHTAKRIFERLREEGYAGGYTAVKDAVREIKRTSREVFMPLTHRPGEAQVDFFEALVKMGGVLRKVEIFLMALPHSDAFFMACFERECTESFQEGHVRAFEFFGGVPRRIAYDNSRIAVRAIMGAHERKLTDGFLQLRSHHLFQSHFCQVRRPNEKGVVEGTGKYARLNFLVPVPQVKNFDELNAHLMERCREDLKRRLRGKTAEKAALLTEDQAAFFPLPQGRFEACRTEATRPNSLSLVRFDRNDYSVPVRWAHHEATVKGFVDRVVVYRGDRLISSHPRIWEKEKISFDPIHYLALLERKPGALDHAQPFRELNLPVNFEALRRRLENEKGSEGTREYIAVLRLLERHSLKRLTAAVEKALGTGAPTRDVVALYLHPDEEPEAATFCLNGREHLQGVTVARPELSAYRTLLALEDPS